MEHQALGGGLNQERPVLNIQPNNNSKKTDLINKQVSKKKLVIVCFMLLMLTHTHAVLILHCRQGAVTDAFSGQHISLLRVTNAPAIFSKDEAQLNGASLAVTVLVNIEATLGWTHAAVVISEYEALLERTHWCCDEGEQS